MKSSPHNYQFFNKQCNSKFLLLCDHASNHIPKYISKTNLGLKDKDLNRHIAYDIGAKGTALELSTYLKAPLISANFSRLVIDPNRSQEDPTSIMQIYDGTIITGNCNLSETQLNERKKTFYEPYHNTISDFIKNKKKENLTVCLVSIHSFTPQLNLKSPRPWHIGILWDRDTRMSNLVIQEFSKYENICVGQNKPYTGNLKGDTLSQHGTCNKLPHVLIEIRNDLIITKREQKKWAKIIGKVLQKCIVKLKECK